MGKQSLDVNICLKLIESLANKIGQNLRFSSSVIQICDTLLYIQI